MTSRRDEMTDITAQIQRIVTQEAVFEGLACWDAGRESTSANLMVLAPGHVMRGLRND